MRWTIYRLSWLGKNQKKKAINPFSKKDNECLSICLKVTLNHEDFKKEPQRLAQNKAIIDKYNGEGMN